MFLMFQFRLGSHAQFTSVANYADAKLAQKFISAIQTGDVKTLHKICKKEFDVNALFRFECGMEKMSALHYATKEGRMEVARELLQQSCDVNSLTPFDMATPLMFACRFFRTDVNMVAELLRYGADVNKTDHVGMTPLIVACELGCLELVRLLLDNGANVNHTYKEDDLPDTICQALRSPTIQEYEIDEMCDAYRGNGPLLQAAREHHYPVVQELIHRGCDLQITNVAGNTALHIACRSESKTVYSPRMTRSPIAGNTRIVKCLLEVGCDINRRNKHGETPLQRAISGISELVAWNIPIEHKIEEAKTFSDIIQILLHYGCDCSLDSDDEMSPVHLLLRQFHAVRHVTSVELQSRLCHCLHLLASAGCPITVDDIDYATKNLSQRTAGLLSSLHMLYPRPCSLKQLCKLVIRQCCPKPLGEHLSHLGLPLSLSEFVALEILD